MSSTGSLGLDFGSKMSCTGSLVLVFGGKLPYPGSLEARILGQIVMHWLTRGLNFGGKLSCTGSLEAEILVANCHALAH